MYKQQSQAHVAIWCVYVHFTIDDLSRQKMPKTYDLEECVGAKSLPESRQNGRPTRFLSAQLRHSSVLSCRIGTLPQKLVNKWTNDQC